MATSDRSVRFVQTEPVICVKTSLRERAFPPKQVFFANVAANSSTAALQSPLLSDDRFEIVPIVEESRAITPSYSELRSWTRRGKTIADFVPPGFSAQRTHNDPDFDMLTYGDVVRRFTDRGKQVINRAASLGCAQTGDELWFIARLCSGSNCRQYLIGFFVLECSPIVITYRNLRSFSASDTERERIMKSANYRRLLAGEAEDAIFVLGEARNSCRFDRAVALTPEIARIIFAADKYDPVTDCYYRDGTLRANKNGNPRRFAKFGQITRTIQVFLRSPSDDAYISELGLQARAAGCAPRLTTTTS